MDELGADVVAQPSQLRTLRRVRYAVNPQLVGRFFDNTFEAPSLILERTGDGEVRVLAQAVDPRAEDVLQATVPLPARGPGVSLPAEA